MTDGGLEHAGPQQPLLPVGRQCREQQVDDNGGFSLVWHEHRHHFSYNMRGNSPDMLGMLAEVASQTLHSEKKKIEMDAKNNVKQKEAKRKTQQVTYNVRQLLTMPATQMIKLFTIFNGDEMKKQYSYTCALVPGCGQNYSSFASDTRAKLAIQQHLVEHLEMWKNNAESYASFTVTAVSQPKPKTAVPNKKAKIQQSKKLNKETLNKENKETKIGKSTNSVRKVLSNEVNLKELENNASHDKLNNLQNSCTFEIKKEVSDVKVLGDHSYYEYVKEENGNEDPLSLVSKVPVNSLTNENIMVMVVENNGISMKDVSLCIPDNTSKLPKTEDNHIENMTSYKEETSTAPDTIMPAKPKGKAKFIGTSKEEREMALAYIEKIRKRGNPSGNNLQCRICNPPRTFTAPTTLVSHYRSHAGIKPYECKICNSAFTRRHSLKYHMLIHQNQTRFTCLDCGKKFRHPSHFREHRRRHTGEAPFGCEDCGQRFKTRNTYKRHLKTRHSKVLTITGELLHLTEEDTKKAKPKNRRKKSDISENAAINKSTNLTEMSCHSQDDEFNWEEQQVCTNASVNDVQQCINNPIWIYQNQPNGSVEENYAQIQNEQPSNKTDFNETEIENNFENNGVVIAQTDSNGTLHFENYNYAQDTIYANGNTVQFSEDKVSTTGLEGAKQYVNQEETIVQYEECVENYTEAIDSNLTPKTETVNNVFVVGNEEVVASDEARSPEFKELVSASNNAQSENEIQVKTEPNNKINIIPCHLKVLENNGTTTLQLLKNSKLALLGNKAQSINLIQNGKQQTFYLLASDEDNLVEIDSNIIAGSKPLPIVAIPAE